MKATLERIGLTLGVSLDHSSIDEFAWLRGECSYCRYLRETYPNDY